jgi:hypothetical protein
MWILVQFGDQRLIWWPGDDSGENEAEPEDETVAIVKALGYDEDDGDDELYDSEEE